MTRVLLLSIVYEPDRVSTASIVARLATELAAIGHDVEVLTSVPHFNPQAERPAARGTVVEDGVRVTRCYAPRKSARIWHRAVGLVLLHLGILGNLLARFRDRELLIVISPPMTFAFLAFVHRLLRRSKVVYNAQELWPDVPRDLGVIKNETLLNVLQRLEMRIYRRADHVVAIGERFAATVVARGADERRVTVSPNFADTAVIVPTPKDNDLARAWGVAHRAVALYAGNIGLTQDFDLVFDAAAQRPDVCFLIVGGGAAREAVEQEIRRRSLSNVELHDFVPEADVAQLYGLADVVLVPLRAPHARTTTPSKIYAAMAAGRPILATTTPDTDLAVEVERSQAGLLSLPGHLAAFVAGLDQLLERSEPSRWDPDRALLAARDRSPAATAGAYDVMIRGTMDTS